MLRSNGTQDLISFAEVTNALGYTPANQEGITDATFPLGNSIVLDGISSRFNGTRRDFTLSSGGISFIPAGSSANLIVSLGGIIQKPGLDYSIIQDSNGNTNEIRFSTAPLSGTTSFIIGLGGQGSLLLNQDYNNKGEIFVATGNNAALALALGEDGNVLTVDKNEGAGVKWEPSVPRGSVFYIASATTPPGYLFCDGRTIPTSGTFEEGDISINASLLQQLRIVLGNSYGPTGTLPNLVNRFAGYSTVPGSVGGSANSALIAHNHGLGTLAASTNDPGTHIHPSATDGIIGKNTATSGDGFRRGGDFYPPLDPANTGAAGDHTHTITMSGSTATKGLTPAGADSTTQTGTNANLPPYLGMRPIIKY